MKNAHNKPNKRPHHMTRRKLTKAIMSNDFSTVFFILKRLDEHGYKFENVDLCIHTLSRGQITVNFGNYLKLERCLNTFEGVSYVEEFVKDMNV